jgi:fructose-specific component phosphotransferase system IIB-like protein
LDIKVHFWINPILIIIMFGRSIINQDNLTFKNAVIKDFHTDTNNGNTFLNEGNLILVGN